MLDRSLQRKEKSNNMFWKSKKKEINKDFEALTNYYQWLIKESDEVNIGEIQTDILLSEEFQKTFPKLTGLIKKARILNLTISSETYKLFSWTKRNGIICGWINKFEKEQKNDLQLIAEHRLLLSEIGGIWESYNQPEPSLSNNQEFLFIESECLSGIGGWDEYYEIVCKQDNINEIDCSEFVCFVREANGDVTLYNPKNKEVFLFAHDHCFDNVTFLDGQPEYTFHKINKVNTFADYVEELANEWQTEIEK